jgi:hypothetical protein
MGRVPPAGYGARKDRSLQPVQPAADEWGARVDAFNPLFDERPAIDSIVKHPPVKD